MEKIGLRGEEECAPLGSGEEVAVVGEASEQERESLKGEVAATKGGLSNTCCTRSGCGGTWDECYLWFVCL